MMGIIVFLVALSLFAALCVVVLARPETLNVIRARATVGSPALSPLHDLTVLPPGLVRGVQGARKEGAVARWRPCTPVEYDTCSQRS